MNGSACMEGSDNDQCNNNLLSLLIPFFIFMYIYASNWPQHTHTPTLPQQIRLHLYYIQFSTLNMDKIHYSQILKLFLISTLLIITPLLSSSLRTTYLYFVVNLLIIALGAEAGLLSFFSKDAYDKKTAATQKPPDNNLTATSSEATFSDQKRDQETTANPKMNSTEEGKWKVEKCGSEKIKVVGNSNVKKSGVQKCPSTPSLFFIGGGDQMAENEDGFAEEEEEDEEDELSGQELFNKAETFIGDFYKQLKMQREESWNRLQDMYHKPNPFHP